MRGTLGVKDGPTLANLNLRPEGDSIILSRVIPGTYVIAYELFTDQPADRVLTPPDLTW